MASTTFANCGHCCRRVDAGPSRNCEQPMKIVEIRETVVPIKSALRNSVIDFSQMTVSVVALITDGVRDGRPIVGYGFNSNGRYAPGGLLRERFMPRLRALPAES